MFCHQGDLTSGSATVLFFYKRAEVWAGKSVQTFMCIKCRAGLVGFWLFEQNCVWIKWDTLNMNCLQGRLRQWNCLHCRRRHERGLTITALAWNPSNSRHIAFCDKEVGLCVCISVFLCFAFFWCVLCMVCAWERVCVCGMHACKRVCMCAVPPERV